MKKTHFPANLSCPLDGKPLNLIDGQLRCPENHSFDIARQGHINLLPVQFKRSKDPGDSKAMIEARQRFLDSAVYQPIADALVAQISEILPDSNCCILDAGCGEGYYLDRLRQSLDSERLDYIGVDISKPAILAATRRNRETTWVVGSNKHLPVLPGSLDIIICLFGFPVWEEFARALKTGGRVVLIDPGPEHLIELRRIIYDTVKQTPPPTLDQAEQLGFILEDSQPMQFTTDELKHEQLMDLLTMTPHLYRASQKGRDAAQQLPGLAVTVDTLIRTLTRA